MRTGPHQLPNSSEIKTIISKESQRKPLHLQSFVSFKAVSSWLSACKIKTDLFETVEQSLDDFSDSTANEVKEQVINYTLLHHNDSELQKSLTQVIKYIGQEDPLEKADVILVFGSPKDYRIQTAISLFHQGYAPKLMLTGKGPHYRDVPQSEAERPNKSLSHTEFLKLLF